MGKVVKGIGKALKKVKPLKLIGGLAKGASKIAGFIPGVGAIPSALLGAGGALLKGEGIGGALKAGAGGLIPGALRGLAGKAGGFGKILGKGLDILKGRGLPGSSGSLLGQLATAVPGVIGAIQKGKQQKRQRGLLEEQTRAFRDITGAGRGLLEEAAPLRQGAQAEIMRRLSAGRPELAFASDRLNPFTRQFNPAAPPPELPPTRRRLLRRPRISGLLPAGGGTSGTPFLNAAVQ